MTSITTGTTTATTALVPVFTGTIQGQTIQLCDARTLHTFMGVLRDFTNWIKGRIRKFGFVEGVDFAIVENLSSPDLANAKARSQTLTDYHLTLDMAKELSMVENNEKGREIRRYFMACEKRALEMLTAPALPRSITPAQAQHLRELVALVVETGKQGHGETWARLHRKMKVNSYLALKPDQFDAACEYLRTKMDDTSIAAIAQKHFPQIAQLSAPTPEPQPMPPKVPPEMLIGLISGGCLSLAVVRAIAMAAANYLYRDACMSPSGYGEEVSRNITKDLPLADLHAIVVRATMEMELRVHGYDIDRKAAVQGAAA